MVGHLVTDPRREHKLAAIGQLGVQFAFQTEQDVALGAPMVGNITGTVFHHAYPQVVELLRAPGCRAVFAAVFGGFDLRPIRDAKGDIFHVHACLPESKFAT